LKHRSEAFLAAGLVLSFLVFGLILHSFGSGLSGTPSLRIILLFAAFLSLGCGCIFGYHLVAVPVRKALGILTESLSRHGEPVPPGTSFLALATATKERLDRYAVEIDELSRARKLSVDQRLEELTEAHRDLVTLHRCTKMMLKSHHTEEVFEVLQGGVREGFGFHGALLGLVDRDGDIVFRGDDAVDGPLEMRIPAYEKDSLVARTLWSGQAVMMTSLDGQTTTPEDRGLLQETPSFLLPVTRRPTRTCSEVKHCGNRECQAYLNAGARCWVEFQQDCIANLAPDEEGRRRECVLCEMFSPIALLVVRTRPDSRKISRENVAPITMLVNEASLALEVVGLHEDLRKMSVTDGLTGLINHREFYNLLRRELERARRYRHTVSLLIIDVDDFKKYNDTFGHLAGDMALKKVAETLREFARATDVVARYGGEEFAIILPESTHGGALMLAERIKTEISGINFLPCGNGEIHLTVSIGIYSSSDGSSSEDQIVGFADEAAYCAKNMGKNRVVVKTHA
jgi:diguanylate cyclase (GGDEF)-like protein